MKFPLTINKICEVISNDNFSDFLSGPESVRRIMVALSNMGCVSKKLTYDCFSRKEIGEYNITLKGLKAISNFQFAVGIIQSRLDITIKS
jgi:hypothetical protein